MRDIAIALIVFGAIPWALTRPYIGVYLWSWISYMNPHKLAYGFAVTFPWAYVIAIITFVSLILSKERKRLPITAETVILVLFLIWMTVTTFFAFHQEEAWAQWDKVMKIQLFTLLTMAVVNTRERVIWLVWVIVGSLGFYGLKGGLFTLTGGGDSRVWGPVGSFIAGNNELGLAMIVTMPLMWYLRSHSENKWVRHGLMVLMVATLLATLGTHSRGALVGLAAMGAMLWWKSRQKVAMLILIVMAVLVAIPFMPDEWHERMSTIQTYEEDASAMGRINAWQMAINMASDRLTGGGFEPISRAVYIRYAPDPNYVVDFHSIYFEVLGEHGFIGLILFLSLFTVTWFRCGSIIRAAKRDDSLKWAGDLAAMLQVSVVGYATAGAFLGMAYFDLPYHIMAIAVIMSTLIRQPAPVISARKKRAALDAGQP